MKNYKMRKGLLLKPSLAFLASFVKQLLIQLKNFDNMVMVLKVIKLFPQGGIKRQEQSQKSMLFRGTVVRCFQDMKFFLHGLK